MKHAIEVLEQELKRLEEPSDEPEEEGILGLAEVVGNFRQHTDIVIAIKILKQMTSYMDELHKSQHGYSLR